MVEHRDVVLAVVGVSAGLAGLALVFLGLVVTTYQSFPADTPGAVRERYRGAAIAVLGTFGMGVLCVVASLAWLITRGGAAWLYWSVVALALAQIITLVVATVWTVRRLMWGA